MEYFNEMIENSENIPVKIFTHSVKLVSKHWHNYIELLFILKGEVTVRKDGDTYSLKEADIIVINANELHELYSMSDNLILALQIPEDFLKEIYQENIIFQCKSFESPDNQTQFDSIRRLLAEMIFVYKKAEDGYKIKFYSILYELLFMLVKQFKVSQKEPFKSAFGKYLERLSAIVHYVEENYKSDINLSLAAREMNLTVPYFSSFFQKHMGTTFMSYVNTIRLAGAHRDLLNSDYSITHIALENGFTNIKSFNKLFKETYGMSPNAYRKDKTSAYDDRKNLKGAAAEYFVTDRTKEFGALYQYLNMTEHDIKPVIGSTLEEVEVNAVFSEKIHHKWKKLITIGKAREGLLSAVQEQLREIQKEIGFRHIRFHGIFEDRMMIYDEKPTGEVSFHFNYVNELFDFLLSIGLKPFIELGFMPEKLARNVNYIFHSKDIISMPSDMGRWLELVTSLIVNCINRYGLEEVLSWHFEFWNEPDAKSFMWCDSDMEYFLFYKETFHAIKQIHPDIQVGGPACFAESIYNGSWFGEYISYCENNACLPDFITCHAYPMKGSPEEILSGQFIEHFDDFSLSEMESFLAFSIQKMKQALKAFSLEQKEVFITEWNATVWHRDLCSDTCYKSCYIVKNVLENMDEVEGLGYWTASDHLEESFPSVHTFHGGMGIITSNSIKKAGYYAYTLLGRLGDRVVAAGENYYITKKGEALQILLYHYCHYDNAYRELSPSKINYHDRYQVFSNSYPKVISLSVTGITAGDYRIKETFINRNSGSAYDEWYLAGCPEVMTRDEVEGLKKASTPKFHITVQRIDRDYTIRKTLEPHEVILIEIENYLN